MTVDPKATRLSPPSSPGLTTPVSPDAPLLNTATLFPPGTSELRLLHRGQEYRLRITRQGKLILTK